MPNIDFNVESKQELILEGGDLSKFDLMSPFVWEEPDGCFAIMVRVVVKNRTATDDTGTIYYGVSADGVTFTMDEAGQTQDVHWDFGTPLIVTVLVPGGLKPGIHDLSVTLGMNPSYVPPNLFVTTAQKRMTLVM